MIIFILAVLCLSQTAPTVSQPSKPKFSAGYAENPFKSHKLALLEDKLVTDIAKNPNKFFCSDEISYYYYNHHFSNLPERQRHPSAEERASRVVENGLLWYKMLSRVVNLLKSLKVNNECNRNVRQTINKLFSDANLPLLEEHDLRQAILGILRIHYVYGYNATSEMRLGIFGDRNTGVTLDFRECLQIAERAIYLQLNALAYQWLAAAAQVTEGNENKMMELNRAWLTLAYQLGLNSTDILHRIAVGKSQASHFAYYSKSLFATCRNESTQNFEYPKLYCYYQRTNSLYQILNPVKVEVLSNEPLILLFPELFGDQQVNFLQKSAYVDDTVDIYKVRNMTLPTKDEEEHAMEYGRFETALAFGLNETIYRNREDPRIVRIKKKLDLIAGFHVDVGDWNIRLYGSMGSFYNIHHDTFQLSPLEGKIMDGGERFANFLLFLADTELGGNLGFPMAGVYAKPIQGNAVFWFNSRNDRSIEFRTFHMGCPVILGKKHIMCCSYYEWENVWKFPCRKVTPVKYSTAVREFVAGLGINV